MSGQSEKQKMITGRLYRSSDDLLRKERENARWLLKAFNDTSPDELVKRDAILRKLLDASGSNIYIEPPFYCDYGYNIRAGNNFYANF
ncbi:MAG: sugar O-acetyltransferase, partial [Betaproteobacteria bacterium]|nr:sugar O-acetyltransferase [Betaproteobacteria bacterium]